MNFSSTFSSASTRARSWLRSLPLITRGIFVSTLILLIFGNGYFLPSWVGLICLQPAAILGQFEVWKLISHAFFHVGFFHWLMNMFAFVPIGGDFERKAGSLLFCYLILLFALLGGVLFAAVTGLLIWIPFVSYYVLGMFSGCTIGLSGVIFTFMVIYAEQSSPNQQQSLFGFCALPAKIYPWALLLLMQFLMPEASFLGHLSGMMIGYFYSWNWLLYFVPSTEFINKIETSSLMQYLVFQGGYIVNSQFGNLPTWNSTTTTTTTTTTSTTTTTPPSPANQTNAEDARFPGQGYKLSG